MKISGNQRSFAIVAIMQSILFMGLLTSVQPLMARHTWPLPVEDDQVFSFLLFEQLEYRNNEGPDTFSWDAQSWIGGDYNRFWVKTEGDDNSFGNDGGEVEVQALYSRLIAPFWDFQAGFRYDWLYGNGPDRSRAFAVIGVQGIAPYEFDIESALFISEDGDVSARLTAEYDVLLTQRLVLQPRFELNVAVQDAEDFGVGDGFNDVELGLRLRYEIKREFAPYIGISWDRKLGNTADITRRQGEEVSNLAAIIGLRLWF